MRISICLFSTLSTSLNRFRCVNRLPRSPCTYYVKATVTGVGPEDRTISYVLCSLIHDYSRSRLGSSDRRGFESDERPVERDPSSSVGGLVRGKRESTTSSLCSETSNDVDPVDSSDVKGRRERPSVPGTLIYNRLPHSHLYYIRRRSTDYTITTSGIQTYRNDTLPLPTGTHRLKHIHSYKIP